MGLVGWLKSIFVDVGTSPNEYVRPPLVFPQLDVEKMKRRLDLSSKGEARGLTNLPGREDDSFDAVENAIITTIQAEVQKNSEKYSEHTQAYAARQAALDIATRIARVTTAAEETSA